MKKSLHFGASNIVVASELRRDGGERLIGRNGELNASSREDLLQAIATLMEAAGESKIISENQAQTLTQDAQTHQEMVMAAFDDREELAALGDMMATNLTQTAARDGFARRLLRYVEVPNGRVPEARMSQRGVTAGISTGPVQTHTQFLRDLVFYPPEFYITARPFIEMLEIQRSSGDILEEKYLESLEGIMVTEDRTWKRMADELIGVDNPHLNIAGNLTPAAFAELVGYVNDWGVSAGTVLFSSDLWQDVITGTWKDVIDPVSQNEILLTGRLGTIHGMSLISDRFRHLNHRVLESGDIYVVGAPEQHGQITDRGGVESQPIDITHERVPGRGWVLSETVSMIIANARSVARGRRTR